MKNLFFLTIVLIFSGCKEKTHENHQASDPVEASPNEALYNEVMKVHDEIMPKMGDIYKQQQQLKDKLSKAGLDEKEKAQLNQAVAKLDSADDAMRIWMREFNPIPDSVGEEKARTYLEAEMEKIKTVRAKMLEALEHAKALQ